MDNYINEPCKRCGSPRFISKTWTETHETFSGNSPVEISQIACTNVECQARFEEKLSQDMKKYEEYKLKKEEQDKTRKEHMIQSLGKKRESKKDK